MTTFDTNNGNMPGAEDSVREAYDRISAIRGSGGDGPAFEQSPLANGDQEIHRADKHPEDPAGALQHFAAEVCDPEQVRVNAVDAAKASQAVRPEEFDPLLHDALTGISRTREGAITGPAQLEAGKQLEISLATDKDVERIVRDRAADGVKADRLERSELPRREHELKMRRAQVQEAKQALVAADGRVRVLRPEGIAADDRPGGLMAWVRFSPAAALVLALVALLINTVVLQPEVANLVNTSELGTYLLAAGLSLTFELASAAAGFALASIRLPGRVVGALFVGLFALVLVKLVVGLDALREGTQAGVLTLTAATLASCYVAGLAGCAMATWRDFHTRRELVLKAGTALGDALDARAAAENILAKALEKVAEAETAVEQLREEISRLRDSAARADAAALEREAQGARAEVQAATVRAVAETHVSQERAAHLQWAYALARLMHRKTRAEKLPEDWEVREPGGARPEPAPQPIGMSLLQKAAIAALAFGAIGDLVLGPVALAIGAGTAAVLLLLSNAGRIVWRRSRTGGPAGTESRAKPTSPTADRDNPLYREQPTYTVPKYGRGDATAGERQ